jgi:putative transposase
MPRSPRPVIPDQPLHIVQRGNNRMPTFCHGEDFSHYLRLLGETSSDVGCSLHAYVLMSNHVHLLVTPHDERGAARMVQALGRRYVRYFNERHGRTGTLWEGRFRSTLIDSERYFLACSRYIELNPERLGTDVVDAIRRASRSGAVLGDEPFRAGAERALHRRLELGPHGGDRRSATFRRARQPLSTTLTP